MADPSVKEALPTTGSDLPSMKVREVWKDIAGYEGLYQISSLGNVKSLERVIQTGDNLYRRRERILSPNLKWNNRLEVSLSLDKKRSYFLVHRLVAFAFLGDPPLKYEVNHKDGNPQNNVVENLEWVSRSYNNHHSWVIGLKNQDGEKNPISKLTNSDVLKIREMAATGSYSDAAIGKIYSVSSSNILHIRRRKTWRHL